MKIETGQIKLGDKTFESTKVDFDKIEIETEQITIDDTQFEASKVIGANND